MPKIQFDAIYYYSPTPVDALTLGMSQGKIAQHPQFRYARHDEHAAPNGGYVGRFLIEDATVRKALIKMSGVTVIYPLHRPVSSDVVTALESVCGAAAGDNGEDVVQKLFNTFGAGFLDPLDRYHMV